MRTSSPVSTLKSPKRKFSATYKRYCIGAYSGRHVDTRKQKQLLPRGRDSYETHSPRAKKSRQQIRLDIRRSGVAACNLSALQRLLDAYSRRNPDVGYVQGMNLLAASGSFAI